jgi:hypothetical protein
MFDRKQRVWEYDAEITVAQITDGPGDTVVAASLRLFDNRDKPHQIRLVPSGTSEAAAVLLGVLRMSEYLDPIDTLKIPGLDQPLCWSIRTERTEPPSNFDPQARHKPD